MPRQLYLVAYDITDPGRLSRALRSVREYALGGQKSVFECWLTPADKQALCSAIDAIIDPNQDRWMLLRLDPRGIPLTLGIAIPPQDPDWFYFG